MGIDESSARYRGFIELSSSQAETGAGFMVVSGGSGTWGHRASPECPQEQQRPGCRGGTAPGRKPELPGAKGCSFEEEIDISVEPCRENKSHPQELPSKGKTSCPGSCQGLGVNVAPTGLGRACRESGNDSGWEGP